MLPSLPSNALPTDLRLDSAGNFPNIAVRTCAWCEGSCTNVCAHLSLRTLASTSHGASFQKRRTSLLMLFGCLVVWLFGCLVVWLFGCLVVWLFGCLVVCFLSSSLTRDARRARGEDTGDQLAWQNKSCAPHGTPQGSHLHSTIGASLPDAWVPGREMFAVYPFTPRERGRSPKNSGLCSVDIRRALFGLASPPCGVAGIASLAPPLARPRHPPLCSG